MAPFNPSCKTALLAIALFSGLAHAAQQPWPAPQYNELESILLEGHFGAGYPRIVGDHKNLVPLVQNCTQMSFSSPAEWIRTAYHDMATHNVNGDGLGGLDMSIRYELDRAENVGSGMTNTFTDISGLPSKYVSVSDALALSVVHAVVGCRGPLIPFRGGRIDATEAGPPGVPEPQQTLEEHTEQFRKQGFNQTEMIELVACGHTVGGVRHADFPEIISEEEGITNFDTTLPFDAAVVVEYLNGTSPNVLVNHPNTTITSDRRIFESDGNLTMNALANPTHFTNRCRDLFEKMINTVPKGVQLTDVIQPIDVKVGQSFLTFNTTLGLHTDLRFLTRNPNRSVTLKWQGRTDNEVHSAQTSSISEIWSHLATSLGHEPIRYWFKAPISSTASISKFWFEVDEGKGGAVDVYDNNGEGYAIEQDKVIYAVELSKNRGLMWNMAVAVRNDVGPISSVSANCIVFDVLSARSTQTFPSLERNATLSETIEGFDFYTIPVDSQNSEGRITCDATAVVNGQTIVQENIHAFYIRHDGPVWTGPGNPNSGNGSSPPSPQPPQPDEVAELNAGRRRSVRGYSGRRRGV